MLSLSFSSLSSASGSTTFDFLVATDFLGIYSLSFDYSSSVVFSLSSRFSASAATYDFFSSLSSEPSSIVLPSLSFSSLSSRFSASGSTTFDFLVTTDFLAILSSLSSEHSSVDSVLLNGFDFAAIFFAFFSTLETGLEGTFFFAYITFSTSSSCS